MPYTTVNEQYVDLGTDGDPECGESVLADAVDLASDQGQVTFLLDERGRRIAAVVPVEFAERALALEG
jgi:hypothetical protein